MIRLAIPIFSVYLNPQSQLYLLHRLPNPDNIDLGSSTPGAKKTGNISPYALKVFP